MNKPMLLIIGPTPPPYMGPSVATKMIVESELKDEYDMVHLDTADRRGLTNIGRMDFGNFFMAFAHFLKLISLLVKFSPRIVYLPICQTIRGYLRDVAFMIISRIFGAHIVIHLRGAYFRKLYEKSNILAKFFMRSSLKYVSKAIVLGESLRYIFEGFVPPENITVVSNGIDKNYITEADFARAQMKRMMMRSANNSTHKYRVLFLSNIILSKGYYDIIKAIPFLIEKIKDIEFIFAGEFWDPDKVKHQVESFITQHDIGRYIIFFGKATGRDKKDLLLQTDVMILPTYYKYEGQPWVIIEAMAAGLPIISTDNGCIPEMIIDGKNGYIIEKKDPKQIAERLLELLSDDRLRGSISKQNRARFMQLYTKDAFIKGLGSVFKTVLSQHSFLDN